MKKIDQMLLNTKVAAEKAKETVVNEVKNFVTDEKGDTNIISIVIILVIVVGLAIVFRSNIENLFNAIWNKVKITDLKETTGTKKTF